MAPIQSRMEKPPNSCRQNLTHSGVVGGGVKAFGPSLARYSAALALVKPCEGGTQREPQLVLHQTMTRDETREAEAKTHLHDIGAVFTAHLLNRHFVFRLRRSKEQSERWISYTESQSFSQIKTVEQNLWAKLAQRKSLLRTVVLQLRSSRCYRNICQQISSQ